MIHILLISAFVGGQLNSITVNGEARQYYATQKGLANVLVVYFHRTGGDPTEYVDQTWYQQMTDIVVASPKSVIGPNQFEWYLVNSETMTDVNLFDAILKEVQIATVYVAGFSAGAIMCSHLAFLRADKIQLVVSMSGGFVYSEDYNNVHDVPKIMAYSGGSKDILSIISFTSSTNIFIDSVRYSNANLYRCEHDSGHTMTVTEMQDVSNFLMKNFSGISNSCTNYTFQYSVKPKDSPSGKRVSLPLSIVYILALLMF
eukprot:NODE_4_length_77007_cov_1.156642.p42 type:complete len:258 gc:universal NODE_4_length_77007_cov_1.156642:61412-60639(-)